MTTPQQLLGRQILQSMTDPKLFGQHFQPVESWAAWAVVVKAIFSLPMSVDERLLFNNATGRTEAFSAPITEAWLLCGRRSGKSRILALLAVCYALFRDYRPYTAPGETPTIMILAVDQSQAGVIFDYTRALIAQTPKLSGMRVRETGTEIDLSNGVSIVVHTSSYKSVRGRTLAAALCDEAAFWRADDSRNPAEAVIRALRPALATIPGAPLLVASSTYVQDGVLYDAFAKHHSKNSSPVMVWKAPTETMNPSFNKQTIDAAYESDSISAAAEFGSEWMTDARAFLPDVLIDAAIVPDRKSLGRILGTQYVAFVDVSGGVTDAMVLCIAHRERPGLVVLDRMESIAAPFKPEEATQRCADILSAFGVIEVTGDRYGAEWVSTMFRKYGITYRPSTMDKSQIYLAVQPLFSQKVVELLDVPKLAGEFRRLERRARSGGHDRVDHPRGSHDDHANAAAGALIMAANLSYAYRTDEVSIPGRHHSNYDPFERYDNEDQHLDQPVIRSPRLFRHAH